MGPVSAREKEDVVPRLSRGARACWKLLDWYRRRFGEVRPGQAKLAERLGYKGEPVTVRQVQRYIRELRAGGILKVERGGRGNTSRYIVANFVEILRKTVADVASNVASNVASSANTGALASTTSEATSAEKCHHKTGGYLGVDELTPDRQGSHAAVENRRAPRRIPFFDETQGKPVARAIERCGFKADAVLMKKLAAKAEFYGVNGFVVAAHIERCLRRVERSKSNWPREPSWITAAVENELAIASGAHTGEPKSPLYPLVGKTQAKQSGGGSPVRVPLAAAEHAVPGDPARPTARVGHETPGTPPGLPAAAPETPRKAPAPDPGWERTMEQLANAKRIGRPKR